METIKLRSIIRFPRILLNYFGFLRDFLHYKKMSPRELVRIRDLYPCINDKTYDSSSAGGHYFYQDIWALSKISKSGVKKHVDVGSRIDGFVGQCSAICKTEFVDLRPIELKVKNLSMKSGDILNLPYPDNSVASLSCLHVLEHIGLGRYGDEMSPQGSEYAARELARVLAPGGNLYIGVPVGRERVEFNAHRVFNPLTVLDFFRGLELVDFAAVDDNNCFVSKPSPSDFNNSDYACGLYHFVKVI